jgi:hypothetical protein
MRVLYTVQSLYTVQRYHSEDPDMTRSSRLLAAALLALAAVLANLAFIALGSQFNYPDILGEPAPRILTAFAAEQTAVTAWFAILALSAALFAPVAVLLGRLTGGWAMRLAVPVGILAATVQVVGLLRWPLLVPGIAVRYLTGDVAAQAAAVADLEWIHRLLGTVLGETLGYLFTATWTILVVVALHRTLAGRWFSALGLVSAAMIATGMLIPLGLNGFDLVNFAGYVLWSAWLVAFAVVLARSTGAALSATGLAFAR